MASYVKEHNLDESENQWIANIYNQDEMHQAVMVNIAGNVVKISRDASSGEVSRDMAAVVGEPAAADRTIIRPLLTGSRRNKTQSSMSFCTSLDKVKNPVSEWHSTQWPRCAKWPLSHALRTRKVSPSPKSRPTQHESCIHEPTKREKRHGADFLAVMPNEKEDPVYDTRSGLAAFLTHGSPKLRVVYSAIHEVCFVEGTKLLVTEDIPLNAKFYEDACRALWIHCEVLHSKLTLAERSKVFKRFNDPE